MGSTSADFGRLVHRRGLLVMAAVATVAVMTVTSCDTTSRASESSLSSQASVNHVAPDTAASSSAVQARCGAQALTSMTLRQKLGQTITVGVTGAADAMALVASQPVGGIFIGSWTDKSLISDPGSLAKIQARSAIPLMVTVDQEGGRVSRLASLGIDSPSARDLVRSDSPAQVRAIGARIGHQLRSRGITVDFAPVVDVSDEPDSDVIGDRSYSNDPQVVTAYAREFAAGLESAGVMPVFKHFPGHGHGSGDSHLGVVRTPALAELQRSDLVPYRQLLRDPGNAGVMVGHLIVPGLTGHDTPASLSRNAITMLRTGSRYGGVAFDGVVFSDDLSGMGAISQRYSIQQAALRFLQAGGDVALWISSDAVPEVLDSLESAVRRGQLTQSRVDASVVRILRAKGQLTC